MDMAEREPYETILFDRIGHTAHITLNRPESMNSYTYEMHRDMNNAWDEVNEDDNVYSVVITGAGRAFCAGADMKERSRGQAAGGYAARRGTPASDRIGSFKNDLMRGTGLTQLRPGFPSKPVIAAIHGICCGDGVAWVNGTDFAICSPDATFFDPHVNVGAHPSSISGMQMSCSTPYSLAIQLLGLPYRTDAKRAYEVGLVTEIVPREELFERAMAIAEEINRDPAVRLTLLAARALYWQTSHLRYEEARRWIGAYQSELRTLQASK